MTRKILLLEPNYRNKYPPMGLMKLATYYRNKGDDVRFFKGNLKEFALTLLCEEYLADQDIELGKYSSKIIEYIKTGRLAFLEVIPDSEDGEAHFSLKQYRNRYRNEDFPKFDTICITTLFTFYWKETIHTINYAKHFCNTADDIIVGGIAATLLPEYIFQETGIYPHEGLLDEPGFLDADSTEIIDTLPLDYSILEEIDYTYPANDAYFAYMTRGCPRKCTFCAVSRLEPQYKDYVSLKEQLMQADRQFGRRKDLLLMDNNVFASDCFEKIIDEIKECGFGKKATYEPPDEYDIAIENLKRNFNQRAYVKKVIALYNAISEKLSESEQADFYQKREDANLLYVATARKEAILKFDSVAKPLYEGLFKKYTRSRYVDFNQGVDARLITDTKMQKLAEINIRPLRIAFDHLIMQETYENAVRLAVKNGIRNLSNYLLYNFQDKPEDLYLRMKFNVELCDELDVTIYSFPMKYHPIDDPDYFSNRDYVGEHWNRKFVRAVQAVLNATKGKIGRGRSFFEEAFGQDLVEFQRILWMPETFIIHRRKYDAELRKRLADKYTDQCIDASNLANEWWEKFTALDEEQLVIVKDIVAKNCFSDDECSLDDARVCDVLRYYRITRG